MYYICQISPFKCKIKNSKVKSAVRVVQLFSVYLLSYFCNFFCLELIVFELPVFSLS